MSKTKRELIQAIISILESYVDVVVTQDNREYLEDQATENLEEILKAVTARAKTKLDEDHAVNLSVIRTGPRRETELYFLRRQLEEAPKRRAAEMQQWAEDKQTFAALCHKHGLSECDANFKLWRSTKSLEGLAPVTAEEWNQWRAEAIERHNEALLNANPETLRKIVKQEAEQKRLDQQAEAERAQLDAAQQRDADKGFPPLPADITGKSIKDAAPSQIKYWLKRFGSAQLSARLRGIA